MARASEQIKSEIEAAFASGTQTEPTVNTSVQTPDDAAAKIAELEVKLAAAQAKAREAEAKLKAKDDVADAASKAPVKEKTVKIVIPLTRDDKSDVFVSVNDRQWLIKHGEEVEVPECVYEVLRNQEKQMRKAVDFVSSIGKKSE